MSEERTAPFRRRVIVAVCMITFFALKLWLVGWQAVGADGSARFDDALFVELANHLKSGDWLGPYNEMTLAKGPGYPLWLATTGSLGLPLLPAQHTLHALAAVAIAFALRNLIPNPWTRLVVFGVLIFDPATFESTSMRVTREGIYPALTLFVVAGLVEIASWERMRALPAMTVTIATGLAIGSFWITREEGLWMAPGVLILVAHAAVRRGRAYRAWRRLRGVAIALVPVILATGFVGAVAAINRAHYGAATVVELKSSWFERAYGTITRVAPENYVKSVPLPKESRTLAYAVSPAFAELRPYLDATGEDGAFSLSRFGEMTGTWFIWAFRDAAASAGHHDTLPGARDFYLRIADEIDVACDSGSIPCGPSRASLAPPWRPEYVAATARAFAKLANILLSMDQVRIEQRASVGGRELIAPFEDIVHMPLAGGETSGGTRGVFRLEMLRAIRDIYAAAIYPLSAISFILLIACTATGLKRRQLSAILVAAWAIGAAIGARLALLAYISASSYPIYQGIYLRVLYPLVYVLIALCITMTLSERRSRVAKRTPSRGDPAPPDSYSPASSS